MACMFEKKRSKIRIAEWCQYATIGRKRCQRWNVPCYTLVCKSQQQVWKRFWPKERIFISHVLRCEQTLWSDNAAKVPRRWFNYLRWINKWINYLSRFNEEFINNYYENKGKKYILEVDVKYPKELHDLPSDLPFLPEIIKIDKCETLHVTCMTRKIMS